MAKPQIIVVTGASAGVGRATVREFARSGASIALIARGRDRLESAASEVRELGGRALVLPLDVADGNAVDSAADQVERELGPIDVWVNNAMATIVGPFVSVSAEDFRRSTEVTYFGQVYGLRAALRHMRPRNSGSIVMVGSALAYRGIPLQSAYCGAKHAIQGLLDSVRSELIHEHSGVKITMVQLPGMNTPQFDWSRVTLGYEHRPVGTIYEPEVAARAIRYAASSGRKEIMVGASTVKAIVGDQLASSVLDHYLAHTAVDGQKDFGHPVRPGRVDNLYEPAPGGFAAHGRFSDTAKSTSLQSWADINRVPLAAAGLILAFLLSGHRRRVRSV